MLWSTSIISISARVMASIAYPPLNPVAFRVGPLSVRWYGLAYLLGFALAYAALRRMCRRGTLRVPETALADLLSWIIVGVVAGGRAGWWVFYHRGGADEPWYEPLAIWHGGMSFHGGLVGVAAALLLWAWRRRGTPVGNLSDCAALVAPLGLFFGRIANFINAELVGRTTNVAWGVVFPGEASARHPSQLYEALLEGPVLLACLLAARRLLRRPRDGQTAALFLMLYGIFRFGVEFTREPDPQVGFVAFGWLTMGQVLSIGLLAAGIVLWPLRERLAPVARPIRAAESPFQVPNTPIRGAPLADRKAGASCRPTL